MNKKRNLIQNTSYKTLIRYINSYAVITINVRALLIMSAGMITSFIINSTAVVVFIKYFMLPESIPLVEVVEIIDNFSPIAESFTPTGGVLAIKENLEKNCK
jgi:hypothetical protein